jgi:hypothetical protein
MAPKNRRAGCRVVELLADGDLAGRSFRQEFGSAQVFA